MINCEFVKGYCIDSIDIDKYYDRKLVLIFFNQNIGKCQHINTILTKLMKQIKQTKTKLYQKSLVENLFAQ